MPDRDATVKGLQRIALLLFAFTGEDTKPLFDAIELITGKKYEPSEDTFEEIAKETKERDIDRLGYDADGSESWCCDTCGRWFDYEDDAEDEYWDEEDKYADWERYYEE